VDDGVAYLDSGVALNAETGTLLGIFYSGGTTVATGPMVSDSSLGKLFILENTSLSGTSRPDLIQAFNESNYTPISSGTGLSRAPSTEQETAQKPN
jgi:trimeric autotransporter adhesin